MVSCARATRGLRRPSLDTRSGSPSSPPSREKIEERWSLRREKTPEPFYFSRSMGNGSDTCLPSYWRRYAIRRSCRSSSCTARGKKARIRSLSLKYHYQDHSQSRGIVRIWRLTPLVQLKHSVSDLPTYSAGKAEHEAVYTAARRAPGPLLTVVGKLAVTTI
jgi:hypothetical protein